MVNVGMWCRRGAMLERVRGSVGCSLGAGIHCDVTGCEDDTRWDASGDNC